MTPLMVASRNGDSEMVQLLLCNGANPKQTEDRVKLGSQKRRVCLVAVLYTLDCVTESRCDTPCAAFVAKQNAAGCAIYACSMCSPVMYLCCQPAQVLQSGSLVQKIW